MKKENIKWILVGVVIALMLLLIFFQIKKSLRVERDDFVFNPSIEVLNYTKEQYPVEKYTKIILDKVFEMDSVTVVFVDSKLEFEDEDQDVLAYIEKSQIDQVYTIFFTDKFNESKLRVILAHELIHLKQVYDGRYYTINSELGVWEGDTINVRELDYEKRPHENEAIRFQYKVLGEMDEILYSTN